MNLNMTTSTSHEAAYRSTNKVLTNTYGLLALTLGFSALTAGLSVALKLPSMGMLVTLIGYFGLLFLTTKFKDSALGIVGVFALTGFMGLTLGPLLSHFLSLPNGGLVVAQAMGATAAVFLGLSGYALTSRKDFSAMGGFLAVGLMVAFLAGIGAVIFSIPALSLAVSAAFVLLASGLILYQTSAIIHGGETNYVMATVSLYVSIFNLFTSLLQLIGVFGGDD